jgi:serine/threonine protein phosphatase PrpC
VITPLEPGSSQGARALRDAPAIGRQATHTTALRRIEAAAASSCGSHHDSNEDAHSATDGRGQLFVVADGVGGGAQAQLASRQVVALLHEALDGRRLDAELVRRAMLDTDRAVARRIAQITDAPGAATVALCAPVNAFASTWLVAWVGDCRVYRLNRGGAPRLELLTRDDTFRHLDEVPPHGGSPDDPARMVGNGATSGANVALHALAFGELLLLCSDGVHRFVDADAACRVLEQPVPLARRCEDLIALARAQGSADDATVLLLRRTPPWALPWFSSLATRRKQR